MKVLYSSEAVVLNSVCSVREVTFTAGPLLDVVVVCVEDVVAFAAEEVEPLM